MADLACKDGGLKLRLCPKHGANSVVRCRWCQQVHGIISAHQASRRAPRPVPILDAPNEPIPIPTRCDANWTDERTDLLKKLWKEGYSGAQIAQRLGGITRNSVIGKVHRLGLSGRVTVHRTRESGKRTARLRHRTKPKHGPSALAAIFAASAEPYTPPPKPFIPIEERKALIDMEDGDCRFACTDAPPHQFCARPKVKGLPYCELHARICFQPPQPRARPRNPSNKISALNGPVSWGSKFSPSMEEA